MMMMMSWIPVELWQEMTGAPPWRCRSITWCGCEKEVSQSSQPTIREPIREQLWDYWGDWGVASCLGTPSKTHFLLLLRFHSAQTQPVLMDRGGS